MSFRDGQSEVVKQTAGAAQVSAWSLGRNGGIVHRKDAAETVRSWERQEIYSFAILLFLKDELIN